MKKIQTEKWLPYREISLRGSHMLCLQFTRAIRGFLWADSHASMESAHKKPRVNCNIRYKVFINSNGDRLNLEKVFCIIMLQFLLIGTF
ncbi:hypothetical protein DXD76_00900 [Firmicutes bacterium TM09-10]|nr:hypothetical protein DXD76_00900 [Firmicutes bacterium TM09-10]